jgi:hypothetical protein
MRRLFFALALLSAGANTAAADEGMWTVNNFPRALVKERLGVEIDDKWLAHQRLSAVRFNSGGSGSFVSETGLVLTNHHVGADCIAKLGRKDADLYRDGFYAKSAAEEIKCPDLELNVLIAVEDVTAKIRAVERAGASEAELGKARRAEIATIEKACADKNHARCDVVTLYRGGRYDLYRYRKYTDVRLVFAPEQAIAFFGGDPDNFNYPRYDLDMAVFRAYDAGKALKPEAWLRWAADPARENDPTFTVGHPGNTLRSTTVAMNETDRDLEIPQLLAEYKRLHDLFVEFGKRGPEAERAARKPLFSVDNGIKRLNGFFAGVKDPGMAKDKAASEARLRTAAAGKPARAAEIAAAFDDVTRAEQVRREIYVRWATLEGRSEPIYRAFGEATPLGGKLYNIARALVRLVDEKDKPSADRLKEYGDAALPALELALYSPAPIDLQLDQELIRSGLARMQDKLGAADPSVQRALAGKTPAARAAELVRGTRLAEVAVRKKLATSRAAQDAAHDPLIELVRALDPEARAIRKRYTDEVEAPEETALGKLARAQLELGGQTAPDATFTLRISFGRVAGYKEGERMIPPITVFAGLFARSKKADNQPPWQIPQRWFDHKAQLRPTTPMNLVTTNDIIGGNSGSPLVNARGELVGLIFDENLHALGHVYGYRADAGRAVSVHASGMLEALRKVYDAGALADELTGVIAKR